MSAADLRLLVRAVVLEALFWSAVAGSAMGAAFAYTNLLSIGLHESNATLFALAILAH